MRTQVPLPRRWDKSRIEASSDPTSRGNLVFHESKGVLTTNYTTGYSCADFDVPRLARNAPLIQR